MAFLRTTAIAGSRPAIVFEADNRDSRGFLPRGCEQEGQAREDLAPRSNASRVPRVKRSHLPIACHREEVSARDADRWPTLSRHCGRWYHGWPERRWRKAGGRAESQGPGMGDCGSPHLRIVRLDAELDRAAKKKKQALVDDLSMKLAAMRRDLDPVT